MDKFIVMDDVSGLADKSNDTASSLTVCRRIGYNYIYLFPIIAPKKSIWQMIISQTKILNIFPGSIPLSKIITNNCHRETIMYIPVRDLWLNRLSFEISNRNDKPV